MVTAGTRFGPYEILAPLGAGGMGEVYRARDTRLERDVAIKVLPAATALSPDARARLTREAKALSSLSDPRICALFDIGEHDGTAFLVMELLDGQTLAARLSRGPLPLDELVKYGCEMADGLARAHRAGLVHRDLKPSNVMITRAGVKLLDFGLAKPAGAASVPDATTLSIALTRPGMIVGTIQYMAPEQLEGKAADPRSDIFALGLVLYEMATGRRAFPGTTSVAVSAAIMTLDPPPIAVSAPLDRLVRGCLAKDPDARWQSAHDVSLQLSGIRDTSAPAPRGSSRERSAPRRWLPWVIAAAALLFAGIVWRVPGMHAPAPVRPAGAVWMTVAPPRGTVFSLQYERSPAEVSPDGSQLLLIASRAGSPPMLWVRPIASIDARAVPGTEGATSAFWSPDGRTIAFFVNDRLKRIDLAGGTSVAICAARQQIGQFGTWGADGQILFASIEGDGIWRVSTDGGEPVEIVTPDPPSGATRVSYPVFLPDGRRFLYLAMRHDGSGRLMLGEAGAAPRDLFTMSSNAAYIDPGYIVYAEEGALLARRFDAQSGRVSGEAVAVGTPVDYFRSTGRGQFSASGATIVLASQTNTSRMAWFDRHGHEGETVRPSGGYLGLRVSPDGHQLMFDRAQPGNGTYDLWSLDLVRGLETHLTTDPGTEIAGQWGPAGSIVYAATNGTVPRLVVRKTGASGPAPLQPPGNAFSEPTDISPDGAWIAFSERTSHGTTGIEMLPWTGGPAIPFLPSAFEKAQARFSPDGHSVAFTSNEAGRRDVYVAPFPSNGTSQPVSPGGGDLPRWSRDGRELFYLSPDNALMAVSVSVTGELGKATALIAMPPGAAWVNYDVAPDGRFIAIVPEQFAPAQPLTAIVNWSPGVR